MCRAVPLKLYLVVLLGLNIETGGGNSEGITATLVSRDNTFENCFILEYSRYNDHNALLKNWSKYGRLIYWWAVEIWDAKDLKAKM